MRDALEGAGFRTCLYTGGRSYASGAPDGKCPLSAANNVQAAATYYDPGPTQDFISVEAEDAIRNDAASRDQLSTVVACVLATDAGQPPNC